jgi:hypothetical protein
MIIARRARNARGLRRSRQPRLCCGRQLLDQLNGWERAHEGHGLAPPEWHQLGACRFVRHLPERAGEARPQRKLQCLGIGHLGTKRLRMARARRPVTALVISIASSVPARSRARYSGVTAVSGQPRNAVPSLTPLGPRGKGRRDSASIGDAARGDDRNPHRVDDLRHERPFPACSKRAFASAVVKACVVATSWMPPPPEAASEITVAALAFGISEISRNSCWPRVKYKLSSLPPACSHSREIAACRSSGFARPPLMYSRVKPPS